MKVNPAADLGVWLTCDLSEAADEQRLVVTEGEGDAVTQPVLMAVFDLMLSSCVRHTQQVLLQQLWTAQHWTVVREGCHEPKGQCWRCCLLSLSEILYWFVCEKVHSGQIRETDLCTKWIPLLLSGMFFCCAYYSCQKITSIKLSSCCKISFSRRVFQHKANHLLIYTNVRYSQADLENPCPWLAAPALNIHLCRWYSVLSSSQHYLLYSVLCKNTPPAPPSGLQVYLSGLVQFSSVFHIVPHLPLASPLLYNSAIRWFKIEKSQSSLKLGGSGTLPWVPEQQRCPPERWAEQNPPAASLTLKQWRLLH